MRQYHRWLSLLFGAFMLWIAVTGVLSQVGSLVDNGGFKEERREGPPAAAKPAAQTAATGTLITAAQAHTPEEEAAEAAAAAKASAPPATAAAPGAFVCPDTMVCRPKPVRKPGQWNLGFLHDLHSGATFGPVGTIISLLSGLTLVFFAISGLWMYLQMFRARARRERPGEPKFFW